MNYARKVIGRIGGNREVDDPDGRFDWRPIRSAPARFPGVYLLVNHGEVVFIGRSADPEGAIEARREGKLRWLLRIEFDESRIVREHPDRIEATFAKLVREFSPRFNLGTAVPCERRI